MPYVQKFFNSANESNPEGELAVNVLVSNMIEIATAHANSLGIGNPAMASLGAGWVLSRIAIEMESYPKCNEEYMVATWVEDWNRHFSVRCFKVSAPDGKVYGYARSVWMVLDMATHENFGTSHLMPPEGMIEATECPIAPQAKHMEILPADIPDADLSRKAVRATSPTQQYRFKYNDIDFYRHVNTVRYVTILLNQFTLPEFDNSFLKRIEISFLHEGQFGDTIDILRHDSAADSLFSLYSPRHRRPIIFARLQLSPR